MNEVVLSRPALRFPAPDGRKAAAWAMLATFVLLWLFAGLSIGLSRGGETPVASASAEQLRALPARQEPLKLKQIAPTDAVALNASIPVSDGPNPAAQPFSLAAASAADRARSLDCLTAAIYYEAATEPLDGQRAVAQVVLNRVRHPAYPSTVCGVVFEGHQRMTGCQFSFTCDGSLRRAPMASYWERAKRVAAAALDGYVHAPVGWATHYHTNWVVPYWASSLVKAANVGTHIFYRWSGGWGRPAAFVNRHAGTEPAFAWRGGFGQPSREERAAAEASARDAAAAAAAAEAAGSASVESFHRAVVRRYEPLQRDSANAVIAERLTSRPAVSASQRWALTGEAPGTNERALGRQSNLPPELTGVRRAPAAAPAEAAEAAPAAGEQESASETAAR